MGKIRVNTIGDEKAEKKQKEEAKKRKEAKKVDEKSVEVIEETEVKKEKKKVQKNSTAKARSARYLLGKKMIDRNKQYNIEEALTLLTQLQKAKFDETVELHINTIEKGVSGNVTLPHGTGKQTKVAVISPNQDPKGADELLKKIEAGKLDFDILIATPDAMPKLAKVARVLGPRGLMPNPKNGTISAKPEEVAKKYAGGQIAFKTEVKAPIIHVAVGKLSFGTEKLQQNIQTLLDSIDKVKMKNAYVKSTMSPSLKIIL